MSQESELNRWSRHMAGLSDSKVESEQARAEQYLDRFERLERRVAELEKIINQLQGGSVASGDAASETGVDR